MTPLAFLLLSLCITVSFADDAPCTPGQFYVNIAIDQNAPFLATFDATLLALPAGDSQRGWIFSIPSPSSLVKSIFIPTGADFYLAFRSLSSFTGTIIVGQGNTISTVYSSDVVNGTTQTHSISVQFQYSANWDVISSSDFNSVVSWLNANRNNRINYVTSLKQSLSQAAANYVTNATNSALVGKDDLTVQAAIAALNQQIASLNNDTNYAQSQLNLTQQEIQDNQAAYQAYLQTLSTQSGKLTQLNGQLTSQQTLLLSLQTANQTDNYNENTFNNAATLALENIATLISQYQAESVIDGCWLDIAYKGLQANLDLGSFETSVRKALLP